MLSVRGKDTVVCDMVNVGEDMLAIGNWLKPQWSQKSYLKVYFKLQIQTKINMPFDFAFIIQ